MVCSNLQQLRVALRRLLWLHFGDKGLVHYKYIMASILATFLQKTLGKVDLEQVSFLKAKLARRVAKLVLQQSSKPYSDLNLRLFKATEASFEEVLQTTSARIANAWEQWKLTNRKRVEFFRGRRAPEVSWELRLFNSYQGLKNIMTDFKRAHVTPVREVTAPKTVARKAWTWSFQSLTESHGSLYDQEISMRSELTQARHLPPEQACSYLSTSIRTYGTALTLTHDAGSHAETTSTSLLTILEMWVEMDKIILMAFPLLKEYHHGFPDELLDVLQIRSWSDQCRLQRVHSYLRLRTRPLSARALTAFAKVCPEAFAARYFDESKEMQKRMKNIEKEAENQAEAKIAEWQGRNDEYEDLKKELAENPSCTTIAQGEWPFDQIHDDRGCKKCFLERCIWRLRINVCEHPLPEDLAQAKAAVFEICINQMFCAYRDGTWAILGHLAYFRYQAETRKPRILLDEYPGLKSEMSSYVARSFGLASTAKKSFNHTHYRVLWFPVEMDQLFVPCGVHYAYYDNNTELYAHEVQQTSFRHHFRLDLRCDSPLAGLFSTEAYRVVSRDGPSSNQVIASQFQCPKGVNVHEFLAIQMLHNGTNRRWHAILQELGSSNLNFSSESTAQIFYRLVHQSGSAGGEAEDPNTLRDAQLVFKERPFCEQLLKQIEERLSNLTHNFREHNCMDIMLMLLFRLYALAHEDLARKALRLIECARAVARDWMDSLRHEILQTRESTIVSATLNYALWAAILCRKTYDVMLPDFSMTLEERAALEEADLVTFLISSLVVQDSLKHSKGAMPPNMQSALISDIKSTRTLHSVIRKALIAHPTSLLTALNCIWPEPTGCTRRCSKVQVPEDLVRSSVSATIDTNGRRQQILDFNVLNGNVLLDGETIGHLSETFSRSELLRELVGDQSLYCFASNLPQMAHMLHICPNGYQIHVGRINENVAIRVCAYGRVYQVLDRRIFCAASGLDLPQPLIDNCIHFLELQTGIIECRNKSAPWNFSRDYWRINLHNRRATRGDPQLPEHLVDVYSFYFGFVARLFNNFESRQNLVIRQPANFPCVVELPRLELTWFVNSKRLLYCKQLSSEIDPNQDAGTLYGLESALVLRDELNANKRSILIPVGDLKFSRQSLHVSVSIASKGTYVSYGIDHVLGRLTCAADSRVISYLALLHAITSFTNPDPLLKRNGTEEALALLDRYCMPSEPLNRSAYDNLRRIASLTPQRQWHPPDRRTLQTVAWDHRLTTTIQHEAYAHMVNKVIERSNSLSPFYGAPQIELHTFSVTELNRRAAINRSRFQRADVVTSSITQPKDVMYKGRHIPMHRPGFADAMKAICAWPSKLPSSMDVSGMLRAFPNIGGFAHAYDSCGSVHKSLAADFAVQFGPMTTFCKQVSKDSAWSLAFALAPLAFENGQNADILNFWLAFAFFSELKELATPAWPVYSHYRRETHPTVDNILPLLQHAAHVSHEDERIALRFALNRKQFHQLQASESKHVADVEREMQNFAQHLLSQWPTHEPTADNFESSHLDLVMAMTLVTPEFQRLFENLELSRYLDTVQTILDARRCHCSVLGDALHQSVDHPTDCKILHVVPDLNRDLLSVQIDTSMEISPLRKYQPVRHPASSTTASTSEPVSVIRRRTTPEVDELHRILRSISDDASAVRQKYFDDFEESLLALQQRNQEKIGADGQINHVEIESKVLQSWHMVQDHMKRLREMLSHGHTYHKWLKIGGLWPSLSPVTLLEALRPTSDVKFGESVRKGVIDLGLALANHQHALRLKDASLHKDWKRFAKEVHEGSQISFPPHLYPEWLLIEIEGGFRIRPDQVEVALASIKPKTGFNSVLQMNMGLGKTSVIMPSIAAHLAGRRKHVMRVIVPRSLLRQTSVLLHARLGRLLGGDVLHVPYSRQIDHSEATTQAFFKLHQDAMRTGAVILAAPEHLLSFKVRIEGHAHIITQTTNSMIALWSPGLVGWLIRSGAHVGQNSRLDRWERTGFDR
jgi:hypothetical protein